MSWETLAKQYCGAVYKFVNNWRAENCPKLNAQTYWNYNNQCSTYLRSQQMEKDQAAAAEADAKKAAADATQKAATDAEIQKRAAMSSEDAAMGRNFSTTMADFEIASSFAVIPRAFAILATIVFGSRSNSPRSA